MRCVLRSGKLEKKCTLINMFRFRCSAAAAAAVECFMGILQDTEIKSGNEDDNDDGVVSGMIVGWQGDREKKLLQMTNRFLFRRFFSCSFYISSLRCRHFFPSFGFNSHFVKLFRWTPPPPRNFNGNAPCFHILRKRSTQAHTPQCSEIRTGQYAVESRHR